MSDAQNQNFRFWQDVLSLIRRVPAYRDGKQLGHKDNETMSEVILLNAMIVSDMCAVSVRRSDRNLKQWCLQMKSVDVLSLDRMMKDSLLRLRRATKESYFAFKQQSCDPSLFGTFWAPMKDYLIVFLETLSPSAFRSLNQFVSFMARTTLHESSLQRDALASYYKTEEHLGSVQFCTALLSEMNSVLREWLHGFRLGELSPRHGPGAISEEGTVTSLRKYELLGSDSRISYLLKETEIGGVFPPGSEHKPFVRKAKVQFVPKSISAMRTICMEPTTLMYFQQACWAKLDEFMFHHPFLSEIIKLHDQTRNREMSRIASYLDDYATIDLSAASDTVSWHLVKEAFRKTDWYKACLLTRSTSVSLPDGNTIIPRKFAPMGSALCFPTECLVFAAVCEVAARRRGFHNKSNLYSVYGDDIVIRSDIAGDTINLLVSLGFIVNNEKSYLTGFFKESCGGEYYHHCDVSPVRIPRNFVGGPITASESGSIPLLIELCNEMYAQNWRVARTYLISKLLALPQRLRPLFGEDHGMLHSQQPTNHHLEISWHQDYQHYFAKTGRLISTRTRSKHKGEFELFMWFAASKHRRDPIPGLKGPEDVITVESTTPRQCLRTGLVPFEGPSPVSPIN